MFLLSEFYAAVDRAAAVMCQIADLEHFTDSVEDRRVDQCCEPICRHLAVALSDAASGVLGVFLPEGRRSEMDEDS